MTQDILPFTEIVKELEKLCRNKATGTLSLTTAANRSAQLAIDHGEMVFIFYSGKMGEAALAAMAGIDAGRFRFQEGSLPTRRMTLPATATILARLASGATSSGSPAGSSVGSPAAPASAPGTAPARGGAALTAEQKQILERCLAEHIGPMATIICEDQLRATMAVEEAIEALAAEVPSPEAAEKFRKLAQTRLA